ncbi:MAG: hypothetical protein ACOZAR_04965 [Patescibacteria group bacterium]
MKKILITLFLSFLMLPLNVLAQDNLDMQIDKSQVGVEDGLYIYDVKVEDKNDNNLGVTFVLDNKAKAKLNLHYNLALVKADGSGPIVRYFSKNDKKIFSVSPYEKITEHLDFDVPDFYQGSYRVVVRIGSVSGLSYVGISENEVILSGDGKYIDLSECRVLVDTEKDKDYGLQLGLVLNRGERGYINCLAKNISDSDIQVKSSQDIFLRDEFSDLQDTITEDSVVAFSPRQEKNISFIILGTDGLSPQAYTNVLRLVSDGRILSNDIYFHYIISGLSGSINKVVLDKDYYQMGDVALLELGITDRADIYNGSRFTGKESEKGMIEIELLNKNNEVCVRNITDLDQLQILDNNYNFSLKIVKECIDPYIKLNLSDKSGNSLDKFDAKLLSKSISSQKNEVKIQNEKYDVSYFWYVLIFLIGFIFVIVLFLSKRKKR